MSERRTGSAFAGLDARLSPAPAVERPPVDSFHHFLRTEMRVRIQSGEAAGTYGPYTFDGRAALEEVVHCIDHILGSTTGTPLKDAKVALAGGAQFGKTTLELALAAYVSSCRFLNPIVYLPDDKLADGIVDAKFRPDVIDQIGWFARMTKVGRAVNESGKAVNTKGAFLVTNGQRKAVGMFRGLQKPPTSFTADVVIEDEKDDIKPAMAKFVSGRMTASAMRFHLEIGTQRVHGSGQNKVWANGTQGVVLLATPSTWAAFDAARYVRTDYGHRHVVEKPPGFINPEEAWPQICRLAVDGTPRPDDPVLGFEGDFRRPGSDQVWTYEPGQTFYYAHPETGEPLDCERPLWHHRVPAKLKLQLFTFRVAQIGTPAIDLQQIVAHWTRAVGDAEEMVTFRCDRQALPKSASQALTPEILTRAQKTDPYMLGAVRAGQPRFAGLDTGDRCFFTVRETASPADKRLVYAAQVAVGDVVAKVSRLCAAHGVQTLFIDERPAVSEARTLALILNGLTEIGTAWPRVNWKDKTTYVALPGGLTWDGANQKWLNLRCAVVRFSKNQLGAGIEQSGAEFEENGQTKFVPLIACNRFESIDRVVREFLTPTENVVEVIKVEGRNQVRQLPAMRLPLRTPGAPGILEVVEQHFLAGSQRAKDEKTAEIGDYLDGIENHFLLANAYSGLAETIGGTAVAAPFHYERVVDDADDYEAESTRLLHGGVNV